MSGIIMDMRLPLSFRAAACSAFICSAAFVGCQKATTGADATVILRDGSRVSGEVLDSSATQLTLKALDGSTRQIEMRNVRAVDYGPEGWAKTYAPAAPTPAAPTPAAPASAPVHHDGMPTPPRFHPPESHITTKTFLLPAGTKVEIRADEGIDSKIAVDGQTFAAEIYRDVMDPQGDIVLPRGANSQLVIRSASKGGKIKGASDLVVDLASVSVGGRRYAVVSSDFEQRGRQGVGMNKRTAEYAGAGSAIGAVIGAIAGHGKGAAIGAGAGAGAGALAEILTKGSIKIPPEALITFQLQQPLKIEAAK